MPSDLFSNLNLNLDLFSLVKIVLGIYLIVCAITGKGRVYKNEYPKIPAEKYLLYMRIMNFVTGPVIVVSGVLEVLNIVNTSAANPVNAVWGWVLWGLGMVLLVGMLVFNIVMTDRKKMQEEYDNAQKERQKKAQEAREAAEKARELASETESDAGGNVPEYKKKERKPDDQLTDNDLWGV